METLHVSSDESSDMGYNAMDTTTVKVCIFPFNNPPTLKAPYTNSPNPSRTTPTDSARNVADNEPIFRHLPAPMSHHCHIPRWRTHILSHQVWEMPSQVTPTHSYLTVIPTLYRGHFWATVIIALVCSPTHRLHGHPQLAPHRRRLTQFLLTWPLTVVVFHNRTARGKPLMIATFLYELDH